MKDKLLLFLKGIVLGIAFIIPGVSGGTLAVLMGIYENLIEAAGNFYKSIASFKKYFMYLLPIALGVLSSVIVCARIIEFALIKAPIITILVFLGMILGGVPSIFKEAGKFSFKELPYILIGIIIVVGMLFMDKNGTSISFINMGLFGYVLLFLVGVLASATMVIPGISGSFTLMIIGYYEPLLTVINELTSFKNLSSNIIIIGVFMLGVGMGIIFISKLIDYLLDKYYKKTYYSIIGFILGSLILVFYQVFNYEFIGMHFAIGIILMLFNAYLIYKIFKK